MYICMHIYVHICAYIQYMLTYVTYAYKMRIQGTYVRAYLWLHQLHTLTTLPSLLLANMHAGNLPFAAEDIDTELHIKDGYVCMCAHYTYLGSVVSHLVLVDIVSSPRG